MEEATLAGSPPTHSVHLYLCCTLGVRAEHCSLVANIEDSRDWHVSR